MTVDAHDQGQGRPVLRVPDPAVPVRVRAEVRNVTGAGPMRALTLSAPDLARRAAPGQFLTVEVPGAVVRRPFWIASASERDVRIVFFAGGSATSWLASRSRGVLLDVFGPLGRGFPLPGQATTCLLVGEGPAAPLRPLAVVLRERACRVEVLLGGRSGVRLAEAHADEARPALVGPSTVIVTRDGSQGQQGQVSDVIDATLAVVRPSVVYTAGRPGLMQAVAEAAGRHDARCFVALQRLMACGIGVCWTCVVPLCGPDGPAIVRSCTEGPVMDGHRVLWETLDDPVAAMAASAGGNRASARPEAGGPGGHGS